MREKPVPIGRVAAAGEIAEQIITQEERETLKAFHQAVDNLRKLYGGPTTAEEDDHETNLAFKKVPGSKEALFRWAELQEKLRLGGTDQ